MAIGEYGKGYTVNLTQKDPTPLSSWGKPSTIGGWVADKTKPTLEGLNSFLMQNRGSTSTVNSTAQRPKADKGGSLTKP